MPGLALRRGCTTRSGRPSPCSCPSKLWASRQGVLLPSYCTPTHSQHHPSWSRPGHSPFSVCSYCTRVSVYSRRVTLPGPWPGHYSPQCECSSTPRRACCVPVIHNCHPVTRQAYCVPELYEQGDQRTHAHVVGLRAITSSDGMTADWYQFDPKFLQVQRCRFTPGCHRVDPELTPG
jgi:hypothetical protein